MILCDYIAKLNNIFKKGLNKLKYSQRKGENMASIIYLGHASFLLKAKDFSLVIDPYRNDSVPNLTFPKGIEVDQVFCSHDHFDHNAKDLVKIKNNPKPIDVIERIVPHDDCGGAKRGMNKIRMFNIDGYKVVHMGDTGCILSLKELEPFVNCDVLLAPINGFFTIGPDALKEMAKIIKPLILIPMHYYMDEYQSGYPDGNMIEKFKKLFPDYHYLQTEELDLDKCKDFEGVFIFNKYRQ